MLKHVENMASTTKGVYESCLDLAAFPVIFNLWYGQSYFDGSTWHCALYIMNGFLTHIFKDIIGKYKELNPEIGADDYSALVKIVESTFKGIQSASQLVLPVILADVAFSIKEVVPEIVHPIFIAGVLSTGVYKSLSHYGVFSCKTHVLEDLEVGTKLCQTTLHI